MSDKTVFDKMESSGMQVVNSIRYYHGEYFLAGLFIGLTKAPIGWALVGLTCSLPTIIILKHREWLENLQCEKAEHILLFLLLLVASNIYAVNCFGKALGIN